MIVKRRLNLEKSDLPLIEVEGNLELVKVWINVANLLTLSYTESANSACRKEQVIPNIADPHQLR